MIDQKITRM